MVIFFTVFATIKVKILNHFRTFNCKKDHDRQQLLNLLHLHLCKYYLCTTHHHKEKWKKSNNIIVILHKLLLLRVFFFHLNE